MSTIVSEPSILITGATDGIGLALAKHYKAKSNALLLIGRRPFADTPLVDHFLPEQYCQVDLANPDAAQTTAQWLSSHNIQSINILIHNAGSGYYGETACQPLNNVKSVTAVNLSAPIMLTHNLLPFMRRPKGKIVFISSVVSALACPEYAVYGATKAALDGFARNLRIELQGELAVQVIHPGATQTGMHTKSGLELDHSTLEKFPTAETVAARIARSITGCQPSVTIGVANKLLRFSGKYLAMITDAVMRSRYRTQ
jgi:short-subunit dehydrogenase